LFPREIWSLTMGVGIRTTDHDLEALMADLDQNARLKAAVRELRAQRDALLGPAQTLCFDCGDSKAFRALRQAVEAVAPKVKPRRLNA